MLSGWQGLQAGWLDRNMGRPLSLAEYLELEPSSGLETSAFEAVDISDPKKFAEAILNSRDFRQYVVDMLRLGEMPSAIITRLMDHAWGKPVERVEHTGKDGAPIVTEVRRIIVKATPREEFFEERAAQEKLKATTH